ncbi:MAG: DnaJ domain-containing protein [FCB group bacterium]|nr:DnaJ domain-containing protein [FCB group bacterium]
MSGESGGYYRSALGSGPGGKSYPQTRPGDFMVSLMVLFAAVMKADQKLLKSELDYVKEFLRKQFPASEVRNFMVLFKDILNQEYNLRDVARQIQRSMDHPSRLQLIHLLFGLAQADGRIDSSEVEMITKIGGYLNISSADFQSIKAMFMGDTDGAYHILEVNPDATNDEIKKAYRRMATKYHPDKVAHLGEDLRILAEEKFKAVNAAYQTLKQERGF